MLVQRYIGTEGSVVKLHCMVCNKPFSGTAICCQKNHLHILASKAPNKAGRHWSMPDPFPISVALFVAIQPVADYGLTTLIRLLRFLFMTNACAIFYPRVKCGAGTCLMRYGWPIRLLA